MPSAGINRHSKEKSRCHILTGSHLSLLQIVSSLLLPATNQEEATIGRKEDLKAGRENKIMAGVNHAPQNICIKFLLVPGFFPPPFLFPGKKLKRAQCVYIQHE